jgi:hypothetical protein
VGEISPSFLFQNNSIFLDKNLNLWYNSLVTKKDKNMNNDILNSDIFNNDDFATLRNKVINMMEATPRLWNAYVATCEEHNVSENTMLMWVDKCIWGQWPGCSVEESDRRILTDCIKWYSGKMRKTWVENLKKF